MPTHRAISFASSVVGAATALSVFGRQLYPQATSRPNSVARRTSFNGSEMAGAYFVC